jgi:hypothetical protein
LQAKPIEANRQISVIDAFVGHHADDSQGCSASRSPWRASIATCISASAGRNRAAESQGRPPKCFVVLTRNGAENI